MILKRLQNRLVRWQYGRLERHLRTASPERLAAVSERRLLKAFHRAARLVPAYGRILHERGVDPNGVTTLEEFKKKVPILSKEEVFRANELRDLCVGGNLEGISLFYSSSGSTGVFSFGVETHADEAKAALATEFTLHSAAGVLDRKTLLINCLPMGVKVRTRTLPVADTSVRPDVIWELIRKLKGDFEQFVLIGEHPFLKKTIEEGAEHGVPWKDLVVHVVTGGEYIAENFRTYLASLLGTDFDAPEKGMIGVSFGLSELAISMFQENPHTIRIRRQAHRDPAFRAALYGRETTICPNVMQYFPQQTFIETVPGPQGRSELVVSLLDPALKIPLIRYNTRDVVETMSHAELERILRETHQESLLPPWRLPVGIVWGKFRPLTTPGGRRVYSEQVKELLYSDLAAAEKVTGNFRLQAAGETVTALVQLRRGRALDDGLFAALSARVKNYVKDADVRMRFLPYEQFPFGFDPDFERKNQYV